MPSDYIPEGQTGFNDESYFENYLRKRKEKLSDLGRGTVGLSPGSNRGESGMYQGGQILNALGSAIPGVSALTGAGGLYERNKDRVSNIVGNIAGKFAPSQEQKSLGASTPSMVSALEKLQDPKRDFSSDLKSTLSDAGEYISRAGLGVLGGAMEGSRQNPDSETMNAMTMASLGVGKDRELMDQMNSGKLPAQTKRNIAQIAQNNFKNLDRVEQGQLLRSLDLSDESSLRNYLNDLTQGKKGAGTDKITRPMLGALVPDDALGSAGIKAMGKAGDEGFTNFKPSPSSGNITGGGFKDYLQRFKRMRAK